MFIHFDYELEYLLSGDKDVVFNQTPIRLHILNRCRQFLHENVTIIRDR